MTNWFSCVESAIVLQRSEQPWRSSIAYSHAHINIEQDLRNIPTNVHTTTITKLRQNNNNNVLQLSFLSTWISQYWKWRNT